MPRAVKTAENMTKHLTQEEKAARQAAESSVKPQRAKVKMNPPVWLGEKGTEARKLWNAVLRRMAGLDILDNLDTEMLATYCKQVEERTRLQMLLETGSYENMKEMLAIDKQISAIDSIAANYAERLGLTPSGRARLAAKRAQETAEDPDGDLFG